MKVLVTGGTGVIGAGALPELLKAGWQVRLLSRGADRDAREYARGVEPFAASVTDPDSLRGAAEGCDAVIHITGIVEEDPPHATFEKVNVEGTRNVLHEAARAGVRRFIYLSSLGADTGASDYHKSKLRAEERVQQFSGEWLILRPGNVYGPGDNVISLLFKMARTLPALPVIGDGSQPFQPIWFEDLGKAIALAVNRDDLNGRILDLAGDEVVTTNDVLDEICRLVGRNPARVGLPEWIAQAGTTLAEKFGGWGRKLADKAGMEMPLSSSKLQMLLEGNTISDPSRNALRSVFAVEPTRLPEGLRLLADELPELLPDDGVGSLERKRFWADISGSQFTPEQLIRLFRDNITEIIPIEFASEPDVPTQALEGTTLTGDVPGRGHFQVRVEEETPTSITLATIEGHPIAGVVSFKSCMAESKVRFLIEIHARPSNIFDWMAIRTVGAPMQKQNWKEAVRRMVELSDGDAPEGVQFSHETLDEKQTAGVEDWVEHLIRSRKRGEQTAGQGR